MSAADREAVIAAVLADEGCGVGSSIHSWRCEYPDRYGPCTCVADLAAEVAKALAADGDREADEREERAWHRGWDAAKSRAAAPVQPDALAEAWDQGWIERRLAELRREGFSHPERALELDGPSPNPYRALLGSPHEAEGGEPCVECKGVGMAHNPVSGTASKCWECNGTGRPAATDPEEDQ